MKRIAHDWPFQPLPMFPGFRISFSKVTLPVLQQTDLFNAWGLYFGDTLRHLYHDTSNILTLHSQVLWKLAGTGVFNMWSYRFAYEPYAWETLILLL